MEVITTMSSRDDNTALLHLDGVLAQSANVHAVAWEKIFDEYLEHRSK
jgi:beta-phosphoglucomutase-like phosphatase (HAD superfamily)